MSAILPHLAQPYDPAETDEERAEFSIPAEVSEIEQGTVEEGVGVEGLVPPHRNPHPGIGQAPGEGPVFRVAELTSIVLQKSHAELITTAWIRDTVTQSLLGRQYIVQARDVEGANPNEVWIIIGDADGRFEPGVIVEGYEEGETVAAWSPPASPNAQQFSVLSWTSKMGCPSFSLPAGPTQAGGSCPGAVGGQSIVPAEALIAGSDLVRRVTGRPVRLQQAICNYCYAEGGQYKTGQVQFAQVMRYVWTKQSTMGGDATPGDGFRPTEAQKAWIDAMIYAIDRADYMLDGGKVGKINYPAEEHPGRYFRWHDSGDIFSAIHLRMMKAVCDALPDITFWAPTRFWAAKGGIEAVSAINSVGARNFIIRPSAYHINEPPPRIDLPGWARGSTAFFKTLKWAGEAEGAYDWDCQTYAVEGKEESAKHTCRHAVSPVTEQTGRVGCRACWRYGDELEINYTLH